MQSKGMVKRDLYWDTLKFVLIFFVVYGHTLSGISPDGSFNKACYNFIFLFHMPLFVFVSGRFSHIRDVDKYKFGMMRILETYFVFQLIRSLLPLLSGEALSLHSILSFFLMPKYTLWYLLCLIYWRLLVMLIPNGYLLKNPAVILTLCFVVSILGGFIPIKILSFQRAITFLPFFFLGYYSTKIKLSDWLGKIHIGIPVVSVLGLFLFVYLFLNFNLSFVLHGKISYWSHPSLSPSSLCVARCLFILVAMFLSIMIMRIVRVQPFIAEMGGATLVIYVFHSFLTQGIKGLVKQGILSVNEVTILLIAITITIGLAYLSRFKIINIMLNPITYMKKNVE